MQPLDEERHERFQSDVRRHVQEVRNHQALLASLANPKEKPMTLFYDEAVEAENRRAVAAEQEETRQMLERLAIQGTIRAELRRRGIDWRQVWRDIRNQRHARQGRVA